MREIKFAWICRNLKFNEIHRVELTDTMLLSGSYPSWIASDNCEVIAKILPTGLPDKHRREIWEGDILKTSTGNQPVIWDNDGLWGFDDRHPLYFSDINQREVIGNIYENPELLEEKISNEAIP